MKSSSIGRRYARALIELADEKKKTAQVEKDLASFAELWDASEELRDVFSNPAFGMEERKGVLDAIAKKASIDPLLLNTLRIMSDRGRLWALPDVATAFQEMAEEREGRVRVEVTTAAAMNDAYFAELQKTLETATNRKVVLVKKQDSSLIGGVVTRMGDLVFDGSLRSLLTELEEELLST